jgi:hypothetical protein
MEALAIYVIISAIIGYLGRERAIGFAGCFVGAFFLTPLIAALILLVTQPKDRLT